MCGQFATFAHIETIARPPLQSRARSFELAARDDTRAAAEVTMNALRNHVPRSVFCAPLLLCTLLALGCAGNDEACQSTRTYFAEQVWGPVFAKQCISCHGPGGRAQAENAKLRLLPSSYPGFLDANLEHLTEIARLEVGGVSTLLLKPLGELGHGGNVVLQRGSAEHNALSSLVQRLKTPPTCAPPAGTDAFTDVAMLDAAATLRKATLSLVGRAPTAAELESIRGAGEGALPALVNALFEEPAFYERLKEVFNDVLLTDRYMSYTGRAVGLLDEEDFPGRGDAYWDTLTDEQKYYANQAIAREPLELIAHVVRQNRPFTEILTADYTLVNAHSARIYGVDATGLDPNDPYAVREAKLTVPREGQPVAIPHAGVLTMPVFLNRFPTTPTNRNRHRARMILQMFLATDILKVADRPIDPTAATRFVNPTREDPACSTCHRVIDPIAGAFQKFSDYDQDSYEPGREWHDEMYPAGFGTEQMQTSDIPKGPQWLARRIANDPRFVRAAIDAMYRALFGSEPLEYPSDIQAADYRGRLRAWQAQDGVLRAISDAFIRDNYNLKTIVRELVLSPFFRAATTKTVPTPTRASELDHLGPGRLLTPEMLSRKLEALTGVGWIRPWDHAPYLLEEYTILYGGIDSDDVTKRLPTPNGVMAGVQQRMANEVACMLTAYDFSRPEAARKLFPGVTLLHVPEAETGDAIPGAIATIRAAIAHLHRHLLGEEIAAGDPELERTYQLFLETWREGKRAVAMGAEEEHLPWQCQAREDLTTGEDLPQAERIDHDENYVVRAWMAVVTYLLLDYRFLYE
jgi:hypothetical protein